MVRSAMHFLMKHFGSINDIHNLSHFFITGSRLEKIGPSKLKCCKLLTSSFVVYMTAVSGSDTKEIRNINRVMRIKIGISSLK